MKKMVSLALTACMLLSVSACNMIVNDNNEAEYDFPVTVGNVIFDEAPQKVAVLSDNIADIILACGYEGKLAARSDVCIQEDLQILPSVGTPDSPDSRTLRDLGVDLVLGDECLDPDLKETLSNNGIEVLIIKPANSENDLKKLYNNVASILGGSYNGKMKAMSTLDTIQGQLDNIRNVSGESDIVTTSCYIYDINGDECTVAVNGQYASSLFEYASVTNVLAEDEDGVIGIDMLIRSNPQSIFCAEGVKEKIVGNKDLKSLAAVSGSKIYTLPKKYIELQGSTRVIAVDYLASKSHGIGKTLPSWPDELEEAQLEYVSPFTPKEGIFYTVGESYEVVQYIEERLIELGYMQGKADKNYTDDTAYAVSHFQSVNGLNVTGIADYDTLTVLMSSAALASNGSNGEEVTLTF